MRTNILIRRYQPEDCEAILQLFYDTVHRVNCADYHASQLDAWAPAAPDKARWQRMLSENYVTVVEYDGKLVGFGDLNGEGYFNCLFVHAEHQREGIASMIAETIERRAKLCDFESIYTEASITARGFFEARGYTVMVEQHKPHNGEIFINYVMKKDL